MPYCCVSQVSHSRASGRAGEDKFFRAGPSVRYSRESEQTLALVLAQGVGPRKALAQGGLLDGTL